MILSRTELMPGVFLNHLQSDKFKTASMSVTLLTQLRRETAAMNALIPSVLRRGTSDYDDMEKLSCRMDELYGTVIVPIVRKLGEIQCVGFYGSIPEPDYLPGGETLLPQAIELMVRLLLSPVTRGGLLLPQYVDSEKEKQLELIKSRVNNKRGYAVTRCIEEMCCFEDYAVGRLGDVEALEGINYKKLTKQYKKLLQGSPIELFYCGKASKRAVTSVFKNALSALPRGEIDYDIGTDLRLNSVEAQPRYAEEELDVKQCNLVMGYRVGECMENENVAALYVFNTVFGGGVSSKLFVNVREKLSLCYYASSVLYLHKGLLLAYSGIDEDKFTLTRDEIAAQLEAIKNGDISDEELCAAKKSVASELRAAMDAQGELEGFWLAQVLKGLDYGPMELAELVEEVSREDVVEVAKSLELDQVFFLKGYSGEDTMEDEDEA